MSIQAQRRNWTYPGAFGGTRLIAFPIFIVAAIIDSDVLTAYGVGWWSACLLCEFWHHRAEAKVIRWEDVTTDMIENAWKAKASGK